MRNVNIVAFSTVVVLSAATAGTAILAATATSTVGTVLATAAAVTLAGVAIASATAWFAVRGEHSQNQTTSKYFEHIKSHAGYAIAGIWQFFAQTLVQGLIQGVASGIGTKVRRKIAGDDHTVHVRHS